MENKKTLYLVLKVLLWVYLIPCIVLVYVSVAMNFEKEQVAVLFFVYLFVTTVFNVFMARNFCCKKPSIDSSEAELQRQDSAKTVSSFF